MNSLVDLIAVVLATGAIIEVWHKGSIFATMRAYTQAINDFAAHGSWKSLWTELLLCPFCQSYHISIYLFCALFIGDWLGGIGDWLGGIADWLGGIASAVVRVIVFGLAATRASNLIEGFLPTRMKYERASDFSGTDASKV